MSDSNQGRSVPVFRNPHPRRGAVHLGLSLSAASLGWLAAGDEWYVDIASSSCVEGRVVQLIDSLGDGQGNGLARAVSVAVDGPGNVFVVGQDSDNAFRIDPTGAITEILDATGDGIGHALDYPGAIAVDSLGNAYVTGTVSDNVFRVSPVGVIAQILDATGDGMGNTLNGPAGLAVDPDDNVYVSALFSSNVFKITPSGTVTEIVDSAGDGVHSLVRAEQVAVDAVGNVFVVGKFSDNAFWITPGGTVTQILDATGDGLGNTLESPIDVAVADTGDVYVAGADSNNVFSISSLGVVTQVLDSTGDGQGNPLTYPHGVAVDTLNNLFVAGLNSENLFRREAGGLVTELLDGTGGGGGALKGPSALALAGQGRLLAACLASSNVLLVRGLESIPANAGTPAVPFCHVQGALDVAAAGDVIHIAPGAYDEAVVLDRDLTLIGSAGPDLTILDQGGPSGRETLRVAGTANLTIDGLTLTNGRPGLVIEPGASVVLMNSTVSGNTSFSYLGGGIYNEGVATLDHVTVSDNQATPVGASLYLPVHGGGIWNSGSLTLQNSTVTRNGASNTTYGFVSGGGVFNSGSMTIRSSALTENTLRIAAVGGSGSALWNEGTVILEGGTISGNAVSSPYPIGNPHPAIVGPGPMQVTSSVVWGNDSGQEPAVPISGPSTTVDHSDVENGWTGAGANNLALDPGFTDPSNGDYSLLPSSPCIDAGDPSAAPTGLDLGGNPRFLDGDLDRGMRVDMGAFEFDNVHLAVSGSATPGGTLTATSAGTAGITTVLAIALDPGEVLLPPFGTAFFLLGGRVKLFNTGPVPSATNLPIPPTTVGPLDAILQVFGIGPPPPAGRRGGNFSNPIFLTVE